MTATLHGSQPRTTNNNVISALSDNNKTPNNIIKNTLAKHVPSSMIAPKDSIDLNGTRYIFRTHNMYDNLHYYNTLLDTHSTDVQAGINAGSGVGGGHSLRSTYSNFIDLGPGDVKEGPQFNTTLISSTSGASRFLSQGSKRISSQQKHTITNMENFDSNNKNNSNSSVYYFDRKQPENSPHHYTLKQRLERLREHEYQTLHRLLHQHFRGEHRIGSSDGDGETEESHDYNAEDPTTWPSNWLSQVSTMILEPDEYLNRRPALNSYQRQLIRRISVKYEYLVEYYLGQLEVEHAYDQPALWSGGSRRDIEAMPAQMIRRSGQSSHLSGRYSSFTTTTDIRSKGRLNPIREESATIAPERYQSLQDCLNQQHHTMNEMTRASTSSSRSHQQQSQQKQLQHQNESSYSAPTGKLNKWSSKMMKIYLKKNGH